MTGPHGEPGVPARSPPPTAPDEYSTWMRARYLAGDAPWDTGTPSVELRRAIEAGELPGQTALEFGCGTGTNALELARRGYRVRAIDVVDVAIEKARAKAKSAKLDIRFERADLTRADLGGPYDVLFDSGVYHGLRTRDLAGFLRVLGKVSRPGTRWLSLAGNANEPHPTGPPVVHEAEIRAELEPMFRIVRLREFRWELAPELRPLAWSILLERR